METVIYVKYKQRNNKPKELIISIYLTVIYTNTCEFNDLYLKCVIDFISTKIKLNLINFITIANIKK